jgi:hypothetical protein
LDTTYNGLNQGFVLSIILIRISSTAESHVAAGKIFDAVSFPLVSRLQITGLLQRIDQKNRLRDGLLVRLIGFRSSDTTSASIQVPSYDVFYRI